MIALTSGGRPDSGIDDGEPSSRGVTEEYVASSPTHPVADIDLIGKLGRSRFATNDDIDAMMANFESMTKPTFRDVFATSYIKFGGPRDNNDMYNIRRGTLSLSG